ncbi:MAG TPA: response regulator [Allosphingosinicella sp.]|nr:response regulator [Allosphingosinicella sp.]
MHALIIEDEPFLAIVIEDHLRGLGYTSFDFALTEAEAVTAARARRPDLITSDVQLPEGSGIAAVEAICDGTPIPVVFITATPWVVRRRRQGAIIVSKPIIVADLIKAVSLAAA